MKRIAKKMACVMLILGIMVITPVLCSKAYLPSGAISADLTNSNYVHQIKSNWCWAAAAENLTIAEGQHYLTQTDAVLYIKGVDNNGRPKNATGTIADAALAAEYISQWNLDYVSENNTKTYYFICDHIYNGHPMIAAGTQYDGNGNPIGGHAVTLMGWDNSSNMQYVKYYDSLNYNASYLPSYYYYHVCTYYAFCQGIYNDHHYDRTAYLNWN